jgi:S-methylmethionine-dependent homocysteine/selenocysteine methylase
MAAGGLRARILAAHERRARPALLDGALGTELERRGAATPLPLWSARALIERPELVAAIHLDYLEAGAELLTAGTFRTRRRTLARAGIGGRAEELTRLAVALAREAIGSAERAATGSAAPRAFVLGSLAPLEDCYRPDLVPGDAELAREHAELAEQLAAAGADGILVETMNCVREAAAAARAAAATGLPVIVSFACDGAARLLSGEPLAAGLAAVEAADPLAVSVNCLPPGSADACVAALAASGRPFGLYPNLGAPDPDGGFAPSEDRGPAELATRAGAWLAAGAAFVGGCCGTGPAHLRALAVAAGR